MAQAHKKETEPYQFNFYDMYILYIKNDISIDRLRIRPGRFEKVQQSVDEHLRILLERRVNQPHIDVPWDQLQLEHLTSFQQSVLEQLAGIPRGETISYGELAKRIKRPNASRAVGQALKKNPYPVLLPCHRVIRSDGSLGGYGGSLNSPVKKRLLKLEDAL